MYEDVLKISAYTRHIYVHMRQNIGQHIYALWAHVCAQIFIGNLLLSYKPKFKFS